MKIRIACLLTLVVILTACASSLSSLADGTATSPPETAAPTEAVPLTEDQIQEQVVVLVAALSQVEQMAWSAETRTHIELKFVQGGEVMEDWSQDSTVWDEGVRSSGGDFSLVRSIAVDQDLRHANSTNTLAGEGEVRRVGGRTYLRAALTDEPEIPLAVPNSWIEVFTDLSLQVWPGLGDLTLDEAAARAGASQDVQVLGRDAEGFRRTMRSTLLGAKFEATTLDDGSPGQAVHVDMNPFALVVFADEVDFSEPIPQTILSQANGPAVQLTFLMDADGRLVSWQRMMAINAHDVDIDVDPSQKGEATATAYYSSETVVTIRYEGPSAAVKAPADTADFPAFAGASAGGDVPFPTLGELDRAIGEAAGAGSTDAFWQRVESAGQMPLVFDDRVIFLYRSEGSSVRWAGDWNGWQPGPGARLSNTDIWYAVLSFPPDARLEYKLIIDGDATWITDPLNPLTQPSGYGPNSVLRMPEYVPSAWAEKRDGVPRGTLTENLTLSSSALGYDVHYRVYTPPAYPSQDRLPVLYVLDGQDYLQFTNLPTMLDNLIADGEISPIIAVFIDPRHTELGTNRRETQFVENLAYQSFLVDELVPAVDAAYQTSRSPEGRVLIGSSLGGYLSAVMSLAHPEAFGKFGLLSPAMWVDISVIPQFGEQTSPMMIFLQCGRYADNLTETRLLQAELEKAGVDYRYTETNEGHSYGNWQGVLDELLIYFFLPPGA